MSNYIKIEPGADLAPSSGVEDTDPKFNNKKMELNKEGGLVPFDANPKISSKTGKVAQRTEFYNQTGAIQGTNLEESKKDLVPNNLPSDWKSSGTDADQDYAQSFDDKRKLLENALNKSNAKSEDSQNIERKSRFASVFGGLFKYLKSAWTKFCSSIGFVDAAQANAQDYVDLINELTQKYGEECIPQSLINKCEEAKKYGRSAMVTHGTLERAEEMIQDSIQKLKDKGFFHVEKTDTHPGYWGCSLLALAGGSEEIAAAAVDGEYNLPGAGGVVKDKMIEVSDGCVNIFYRSAIIRNGNGEPKTIKISFNPPLAFPLKDVQISPEIYQNVVQKETRARYENPIMQLPIELDIYKTVNFSVTEQKTYTDKETVDEKTGKITDRSKKTVWEPLNPEDFKSIMMNLNFSELGKLALSGYDINNQRVLALGNPMKEL